MSTTGLLERRERALGRGMELFYEEPVHIVRGEGVHLYDESGRQYVDMYNNVPSVGHCHPHVVSAIVSQAAILNVHSRYLHEGVVEYAERLTAKHHDGIDSAVFACSGTEAVEIALMMARGATGGQGIVCTDASYHGNSTEVRKLTNCKESSGEVRSFPFPDTYRYQGDVPAADYYLGKLEETIAGFARDGIAFAGLVACSIFANEGIPNLPEGFMARAADIVHRAGGLFMADEVQAGLCRSGDWWGYETTGYTPDIVILGKPIAAGMPLSGVVASRELVEEFRSRTRYFNTYASCPLQASAGNAVLDVLEREGLCDQVREVGDWLLGELRNVHQRCEPCGEVRGKGLFLSLEWVTDRESKTPDPEGAKRLVNTLRHKGYLIGYAGAYDNAVKLRPPLVFNRENAEDFVTVLNECIDELYG